MTAQKPNYAGDHCTYCHIHNTGVANTKIFNDESDFKTFVSYLEEYLTPPSLEKTKKTFTVNGRSYQGVPHLPKNYAGSVELIAYSLTPESFHLLLKQLNKDAQEKFMRSISTRYSIYFNKKYNHKGPIFKGPYRSEYIKDDNELFNTTHFLHRLGNYSSYSEYLGIKSTPWIKHQSVLSAFAQTGMGGYKDFVENTSPAVLNPVEVKEEKTLSPPHKTHSRIPAYLSLTGVFLMLTSLGVRNIMAVQATQLYETVLSEQTDTYPIKPDNSTTATVTIVTKEDSKISVREKPSTESAVIDKAAKGEIFKLVSTIQGWYEIKLNNGSTGYVSGQSAKINNQNE